MRNLFIQLLQTAVGADEGGRRGVTATEELRPPRYFRSGQTPLIGLSARLKTAVASINATANGVRRSSQKTSASAEPTKSRGGAEVTSFLLANRRQTCLFFYPDGTRK